MADAQEHLGALGYDCSMPGKTYVSAHSVDIGKIDAGAYLAHLRRTAVAFAPKTNSNCLRFGRKRNGKSADNYGVAIFWRRDEFAPAQIDFLAFNDPSRNQGVRHRRGVEPARSRRRPPVGGRHPGSHHIPRGG